MPVVYKIIPSPHVHLVSYYGVATNEEMLACYKQAYKDPLYQPGIPEISDVRHAAGIDIDFHGIQELVNWVDSRDDLAGTNTRVGILQGDAALAGISKLYAAVSDSSNRETVRVFSDLPSLLDWLPLDRKDLPVVQSELAALLPGPADNPTSGDNGA